MCLLEMGPGIMKIFVYFIKKGHFNPMKYPVCNRPSHIYRSIIYIKHSRQICMVILS